MFVILERYIKDVFFFVVDVRYLEMLGIICCVDRVMTYYVWEERFGIL